MDVDAYNAAHHGEWLRLNVLSRKRSLSGADVDELVWRYRQSAAQLAHIQTLAPQPQLIAGLSATVARAHRRIVKRRRNVVADAGSLFSDRFPLAVWRARGWILSVALGFVLVSAGLAVWFVTDSRARRVLGIPADSSDLTNPGGSFETYYSQHSHDAFAAQVWTNNAWVCAICLVTGVLLLPTAVMLTMNALNIGVSAGMMTEAHRLGAFFGFVLPHGMLELTAVFIAGGVGLRLGWAVVDPGRLSRAESAAKQGREAVAVAVGLIPVLLISGLLEGFVTPSPLPTPLRVGIGATVELLFLGYLLAAATKSNAHTKSGEFEYR